MAENTIRLMGKALIGLGAVMTLMAVGTALSFEAPKMLAMAPIAMAAALYGRFLDRRHSAAL